MAIMQNGKILEIGKPRELYTKPQKLETARFLGDMNIFKDEQIPIAISTPAPLFPKSQSSSSYSILCIRPENVLVHAQGATAHNEALLPGTLTFVEFLGSQANLGFTTSAGRVLANLSNQEAEKLPVGQAFALEFPIEHRLWY
jgi:ABC-type sugar transport system ATPase subunit